MAPLAATAADTTSVSTRPADEPTTLGRLCDAEVGWPTNRLADSSKTLKPTDRIQLHGTSIYGRSDVELAS